MHIILFYRENAERIYKEQVITLIEKGNSKKAQLERFDEFLKQTQLRGLNNNNKKILEAVYKNGEGKLVYKDRIIQR